jgi:hypothetical protein
MDEFYRDRRPGAGRQLLDLLCVALLGLILTLAAGAISRAQAPAAAAGHGKAAADCDTPAKVDQTVATAFPAGAALAPCGDGEKTPAAPAAH